MTTDLRFYADSANVQEIAPLLDGALIRGVTTNPTILAKANKSVDDIEELYRIWQSAGAEEIFFQTWGKDSTQMMANAQRIAELGEEIVVKVPATSVGFPVAAHLVRSGTPVLLTAVYSPSQALAAASIGARYIAPYLGRLEDSNRDGVALIGQMQRLITGTGTDVLAASLRTPAAIVDLAEQGVRFFTASPPVLWAVLSDADSDRSAAVFESAVHGAMARSVV